MSNHATPAECAEPPTPMCSCGHTIGSHFAEPYCPACDGDPCDFDFADWLAEHDRKVTNAALAPVEVLVATYSPSSSRIAIAALRDAIHDGRDLGGVA